MEKERETERHSEKERKKEGRKKEGEVERERIFMFTSEVNCEFEPASRFSNDVD